MSPRDNYYTIERFGERVSWMVRHLKYSEHCRYHPVTYASVRDCFIDLPGKYEVQSRAWQRYANGESSIPYPVVRELLALFPDLTEEMVICPSFADFELKAEALTKAHARWNAAIGCMAKERTVLAGIAKEYYSASKVDEVPSFSLVTRKDWILPRPIEMTETAPAVTFKRDTSTPKVAGLDGLNIDYVDLKSRKIETRQSKKTEKRQSEKDKIHITNGDCYRLMNIRRVESSLEFDFQATTYFEYVNTCEILGVELADQYLKNERCSSGVFMEKYMDKEIDLPRRDGCRQVFNFENRAAFLGVNCFLMIRNFSRGANGQGGHIFYIHDRSEKTLEAQNTLHVVPAGGHQPFQEYFGNMEDVSLWRTAAREFCEELFSREDLAKAKRDGETFIEKAEVVEQMKIFFKSKAARLYMLGVGIDPLTTKPELLIAIVVDWPKAQMAGGKSALKIEENYEGKAAALVLNRKALKDILDHPPRGKPWLPAGRACIELAMRHYDFLMGESA